MKEQMRSSVSPALGGTSLMVIFCILCLTIFSLLTLTAAQAEKKLSESFAQSVYDFYQADTQAEAVFTQLRVGVLPDFVQTDGQIFTYQVPISRYQTLQVQLQKDDSGWTVLQWQVMAHPESIEPATLPLWDGNPLQEVSP